MIQDMLRVFIIRIACQKVEDASILLRPIFSWIGENISNTSFPSELDAYKVKMLVQSPSIVLGPITFLLFGFSGCIIYLLFLSLSPSSRFTDILIFSTAC